MKICKKEVKPDIKVTNPRCIEGHLYKNKESKDIYIAGHTIGGKILIHLVTGNRWNDEGKTPFGMAFWEDVTDKYCLQEI